MIDVFESEQEQHILSLPLTCPKNINSIHKRAIVIYRQYDIHPVPCHHARTPYSIQIVDPHIMHMRRALQTQYSCLTDRASALLRARRRVVVKEAVQADTVS